jgi:hypothetical protein
MSTEAKTRLQSVDPYEFETLVAEVWEADGWDTQVSQASNDMGVDVEAYKTDGIVDQKAVIQAKRYSGNNKIGRPKIQQYHALKEQDPEADVAVVVTTSSFTSTAEEWAADHNVKLVDGDDLLHLIEERNAEELIDEYAPPLSEIESEEETADTETTSATSTDTTSTSASGALGGVVVALVLQIIGMANVLQPALIPALSATAATWIFAIGFIAGPVTVFRDQRQLGKGWGASILWPALALFLGGLFLLYYVLKR